jgi:hypothetical protein
VIYKGVVTGDIAEGANPMEPRPLAQFGKGDKPVALNNGIGITQNRTGCPIKPFRQKRAESKTG